LDIKLVVIVSSFEWQAEGMRLAKADFSTENKSEKKSGGADEGPAGKCPNPRKGVC
jgi:hypothetical protein